MTDYILYVMSDRQVSEKKSLFTYLNVKSIGVARSCSERVSNPGFRCGRQAL